VREGAVGRVDKAKVKREIQGWVITILAVLAFRTLLYEAVYIPSGSMIPTLQIGDYVVVEKWAYGLRFPFTDRAQVQWSSPRRGDIVVLLAPPGNPRNDDLIKRVVGVGGDTVEVRNGALWLNGKPVPRRALAGPCTYENRLEGVQ
jgi:signal peptidase I